MVIIVHEICLSLGTRSYPIFVGSRLVDQLKDHLPNQGKIALVTTPIINDLYGSKLAENIGEHELILVPDSEEAKDWNILEGLLGTLIQCGLDRKCARARHSVNHGEGVSIGMVAASWISKENGHLSESNYHKIKSLLEDYRLPTRIPRLNATEIIEVMHRDKKAEAGNIKFVLPTGIGKTPLLRYVSDEKVTQILEELIL